MFRVTREIRFCYGHRLLNYDSKCRHLHGHNGRAVITLETPQLDPLGMVVDFTRIKRIVSRSGVALPSFSAKKPSACVRSSRYDLTV